MGTGRCPTAVPGSTRLARGKSVLCYNADIALAAVDGPCRLPSDTVAGRTRKRGKFPAAKLTVLDGEVAAPCTRNPL